MDVDHRALFPLTCYGRSRVRVKPSTRPQASNAKRRCRRTDITLFPVPVNIDAAPVNVDPVDVTVEGPPLKVNFGHTWRNCYCCGARVGAPTLSTRMMPFLGDSTSYRIFYDRRQTQEVPLTFRSPTLILDLLYKTSQSSIGRGVGTGS